MKKIYWVLVVIVVLIVVWFCLRFIILGDEDSWIKDERGVWIKHGNPSDTPDYVEEQQIAVSCAVDLYNQKKTENLSSQCLGTCGDYAIDIVHVPRSQEDNLVENQCEDYRLGKVSKFIELDKFGEIVRIV